MAVDPYAVLSVKPEDTDEVIRARYLELVKQFTPDHHPDKFGAIRVAYEQVKTVAARAKYRLFEQGKRDNIDDIIEEVSKQAIPRRRFTLQTLLAAQKTR